MLLEKDAEVVGPELNGQGLGGRQGDVGFADVVEGVGGLVYGEDLRGPAIEGMKDRLS